MAESALLSALGVLAVLLSLLISAASIHCGWQARRLRMAGNRGLRYIAHRQRELVLFSENHRQLLEAQDILESTVDGTTSTVRAVHKGIAAIPFGILEAIPATRDTTRVVRGTHDLISDAVYGGISLANRAAGSVTRKGLGAGSAANAADDANQADNPADADALDPPGDSDDSSRKA